MDLTSGSFLALISAAAVGWFAATVVLWPRLAGRRREARATGPAGRARTRPAWLAARLAGRGAGRIGLLAVGQALVVGAFLVWLNGYFAFYGSWSDLLGHGAAAVQQPSAAAPGVVRALPAASQPARLPGDIRFYGAVLGPGPGVPPAVPGVTVAGHGTRHLIRLPGARRYGEILRIELRGQRTGLQLTGGYVYLPPQYFRPAFARYQFPAVLALTGYPGGASSIIRHLGVPGQAAALVSAGRARPAVYVMLNVSPAFPRDTECTNVPAGPQVASFFAIDVPQAIEQVFRVTSNRGGWGTLGYSTGGYCAVKLAMLYPSRFAAAISLAGYYRAVRDVTTGQLYGGSAAYRHENDLFWRLKHLPAPPVSVLVTSSKIGEGTYPGTMRFLRLIRPPMRGYAYILPVGGHNFLVWAQELPQALKWLSARLQPGGRVPGSPLPAWLASYGSG